MLVGLSRCQLPFFCVLSNLCRFFLSRRFRCAILQKHCRASQLLYTSSATAVSVVGFYCFCTACIMSCCSSQSASSMLRFIQPVIHSGRAPTCRHVLPRTPNTLVWHLLIPRTRSCHPIPSSHLANQPLVSMTYGIGDPVPAAIKNNGSLECGGLTSATNGSTFTVQGCQRHACNPTCQGK